MGDGGCRSASWAVPRRMVRRHRMGPSPRRLGAGFLFCVQISPGLGPMYHFVRFSFGYRYLSQTSIELPPQPLVSSFQR